MSCSDRLRFWDFSLETGSVAARFSVQARDPHGEEMAQSLEAAEISPQNDPGVWVGNESYWKDMLYASISGAGVPLDMQPT